MWHIKKLIKQHDHYTGATCAGDKKKATLKCAVLSHNTMTPLSQVFRELAIDILTAGISTRVVARELNVDFTTISIILFREFSIMSNRSYIRRTRVTMPAQDLHIWLLHLRDRLRPATQTADETEEYLFL